MGVLTMGVVGIGNPMTRIEIMRRSSGGTLAVILNNYGIEELIYSESKPTQPKMVVETTLWV